MTEEITLRPVKTEDSALIADIFNNSSHIKYMSTYVRCKEHTVHDVKKSIEESDPNYEHLFMIIKDGEAIGHAGIDEIDMNDKRGEIFFVILGNETGKGYGKKTVKLLLEYAFNQINLNSIFATATIINYPSLSVLEKSGFKKIGVRRDYNYIDGKYFDEVFFDITLNDYKLLQN